MEGHLFVVDPDTSRVISRVASLDRCKNEDEARSLVDHWQDRVGDAFVILDSRKYDWLATAPCGERSPALRQSPARQRSATHSASDARNYSARGRREFGLKVTLLAVSALLTMSIFGLSSGN